jgi:hypothetical protein
MRHYYCIIIFSIVLCIKGFPQQTQLREFALSTRTAQTPFAGIDGMTVSGPSLYIVDRVMNRIALLNVHDLTFRSEYSHSDNPEASLLMPGFVAVTSKNIFIADFGKSSIRVYTKDFRFQNIINIEGEIFAIASDNKENIWVGAATFTSAQSIKKIDLSGNVLQELVLNFIPSNLMERYYTFCIDENDYFYVALYTRNIIEVLHPQKGFIRQFMVPGLPANVPWSKINKSMFFKGIDLPDGVIFSSITSDKNGRLFILTGDYSETPFREIDICSTAGKFLSWCNLQEKSHLIHMDNEGHLISVEGNKNKVKIYELKYPSNR